MARLNKSFPVSTPSTERSMDPNHTPDQRSSESAECRRSVRASTINSFLSSPCDPSSDKENQPDGKPIHAGKSKGSIRQPLVSMTIPDDTETPRASKRRKRHQDDHVSVATSITAEPITDLQYYDPDQPGEERRQLRQDMRVHLREFNDDRDALMAGSNDKLIEYIEKSNQLMNRVKQTADATLDARFLVAASDLTLKKTTAMVMGANSTGIDLDEFVSKCILFMQHDGYLDDHRPHRSQAASTQSHARRLARRGNADSDVEQEETGDALAWNILGERACFCNNSRPPVSSFLLGPLSVQKRVRSMQSQRRGRLQRNAQLERRPESLEPEDMQRPENSNLVTLVSQIRRHLETAIEHRMDAVNNDLSSLDDDCADEAAVFRQMQEKHGLAETHDEDPAISLFEFTINPESFGQTVENLFYTSFLLREGSARIEKDAHGLPIICPAVPSGLNQQKGKNISRHQAVMSIDYPMWQNYIKAFDIKQSLIPNRKEQQPTDTVRGWYR